MASKLKNGFMKVIAFSLLIVGLNSCKKDFIYINNPSSLTVNNFYNSAADLKTALTADYSSLQAVYNYWYRFAELPSDNSTTNIDGTGEGEFDVFNIAVDNPACWAVWQYLYTSIAKSNIVINKASAISMNDSLRTQYVSEAKFIRALVYFNLVRAWGDVPLITNIISNPDDALLYNRISTDSVYQQIIKDLTDIENVLPTKYTGNDIGRITSVAAKTLLGEVYLTQKAYSSAASKFNEAIVLATNNGAYLLPDYASIFNVTNSMNPEIIASILYKSGLQPKEGSVFSTRFTPAESGSTIIKNGRPLGYNIVSKDLYLSFETGDVRRDISIGVYNSGYRYYTKKTLDVNQSLDNDADADWVLYRLSDLVLMYAEALNETNDVTGAIAQIKTIRARVGLPTNINNTQADVRTALEKERRTELCMEGHRWFDLLRTGRVIDVMNTFFKKYPITSGLTSTDIGTRLVNRKCLFPIPQQERAINLNLTQNAGY